MKFESIFELVMTILVAGAFVAGVVIAVIALIAWLL